MVLRIWGFVYRGLGGDPLLSTAVLLLGHAGPWEEGTWAFEQSLDLLSEAQGSPMEVLGWQWSCTCSKHSVFPGMQALAHGLCHWCPHCFLLPGHLCIYVGN